MIRAHRPLALAVALASLTPLTSLAEEEPSSQAIEEVRVYGYRSSLADSLALKREADQIIDVITAEEIGQFPDQNVAEALQRITGVQITRNNGEGETVNIRGLAATFTRVEVDGRSTNVTIDSANPERQSVLSVFASDLYNEIEVVKSPTAADVEGGIGGIVRLKTPEPLEIGELFWGLESGITSADQRDDEEPQFNGFFSNVYLDGRLGVLISGLYEERDRAIDKFQSNQDWIEIGTGDLADDTDPAQLALVGARFPGRLRQEQRQGEAPKYNLNAKIQFMATPELELFANGYYTREEREEDRARIQVQLSRGDVLGGTAVDGTLVEGRFDRARAEFLSFTREADIETEGFTTGFEWNDAMWSMRGTLNVSSSEEDFDEWRVSHRTNRDGLSTLSILDDPEYPALFTEAVNEAPADLDLRQLDFQQRVISIEETSFQFDAERLVDWGTVTSLEFGARYAETEFDRLQGAVGSPETGNLSYADGLSFVIDGDFADDFGGPDVLTTWPSIDPKELYERFPSTTPFAFDDENLYEIEEAVTALYGLVNFESDAAGYYLRGNVGVRWVTTDYEGQGRVNIQSTSLPPEFDPDGNNEVFLDDEPSLEQDYDEWLPALNLLVSADRDAALQFRASVSRALSRPTVNEIQPGVEVNTDDGDIVRGNPAIQPFTAWQYDFGVEYYLDNGGGITATFFVKDVDDFIAPINFAEDNAFPQVGLPTQTFQVSTFVNGGEAQIQGVEIGAQAPFDFLPEPWNGLGVYANYTYTDSEFDDTFGNTFDFPGASEHAYNIVGFYEKGGFSTRVAYNYRDDFLIVPSSSADGSNAQFGEEQGRVDLSLRYRWDSGLRIAFDALNLTEEQNYKFYDTPARLEDLEVEGRIYTLRVGWIH